MGAVYSLVASDWSISAGKVIDYIGDDHGGVSPSYASGIQFHRWAGDLSDDPAYTGDDILDRTKPVASKRSTDYILTLKNGYTLTDAAAEHLYDVSITQGTEGVDQKIWDAITVYGNCPVIHVLQAGLKIADDYWNNDPDSLGLGLNSTTGISHRFLVKVHDYVANGGDIDGRRLIGTSRAWNKTWKEFPINGTERGKNTLALDQKNDLNNTQSTGTIGALVGISNQNEGYIGIDADGNGSDEYYYASWTKGVNSTKDLYEWVKLQGYDGSAATLYGLPASSFRGITHSVAISGGAGTWVEPESLSWGSGVTAGTGQLLAVDNTTSSSATVLHIQLLTGVIPAANTITGNGGATATAGTVTERSVETPFIGASTGAAIIGGFGFGISSILSTADTLTDLAGNAVTPPDVVSVTIGNLFKGSVTLYPWDGSTVDSDGNPVYNPSQMTLTTALTGAAVTSVVVNVVPDNTPDTGFIRIELDSGNSKLVAYTAVDTGTDTYTIGSTDFSGDNASISNGAWNAYLDTTLNNLTAGVESFTYTYGSDVKAVLEVRDTPNLIQPYVQPVTLSNTSQTINAIRNSDA